MNIDIDIDIDNMSQIIVEDFEPFNEEYEEKSPLLAVESSLVESDRYQLNEETKYNEGINQLIYFISSISVYLSIYLIYINIS